MSLSGDGRTLAVTVNKGGYQSLSLIDTRSRKIAPVKNLPAGMVSGITGATFVAAPALSVGLYTLHPALPFQVVIAGCLALALWARGRMPLAEQGAV